MAAADHQPGRHAVMAYDPADGKEILRVKYEGYSVIPRPVYGHGMVFLSTSYDTRQAARHPGRRQGRGRRHRLPRRLDAGQGGAAHAVAAADRR